MTNYTWNRQTDCYVEKKKEKKDRRILKMNDPEFSEECGDNSSKSSGI